MPAGELHYRLTGGLIHYTAYSPFTVDGIHYWRNSVGGVHVSRPMIQLLIDTPDDDGFGQFPSDPPTDAELDVWVKHGQLPST